MVATVKQTVTVSTESNKRLSLQDMADFVEALTNQGFDDMTRIDIKIMDDQRDGYQVTLTATQGQLVS